MMGRVSHATPPLPELLASARVVALPLATRFRGVDVREALLFEGPEGWTEFSPFAEYDDREAATWLAAAIDFGWMPQPAPVRNEIPVNATVPAVAGTSPRRCAIDSQAVRRTQGSASRSISSSGAESDGSFRKPMRRATRARMVASRSRPSETQVDATGPNTPETRQERP